jgi:hypothetical protein
MGNKQYLNLGLRLKKISHGFFTWAKPILHRWKCEKVHFQVSPQSSELESNEFCRNSTKSSVAGSGLTTGIMLHNISENNPNRKQVKINHVHDTDNRV